MLYSDLFPNALFKKNRCLSCPRFIISQAMKKLLAIFGIMIASVVALHAQDGLSVSYDTFKSWMKQSAVSGFSFVDADQENGGYAASFMQLNKMIKVKMVGATHFDEYKSAKGYDGTSPYDLKGGQAVFVGNTSSSSLFIRSSKVNATLVITTQYFTCSKGDIEKMAIGLGLGAKF